MLLNCKQELHLINQILSKKPIIVKELLQKCKITQKCKCNMLKTLKKRSLCGHLILIKPITLSTTLIDKRMNLFGINLLIMTENMSCCQMLLSRRRKNKTSTIKHSALELAGQLQTKNQNLLRDRKLKTSLKELLGNGRKLKKMRNLL